MKFDKWNDVSEEVKPGSAEHYVTYFFNEPLTLDQWSQLDTKMSEAIDSIVGDDFDYFAIAGPIPER